MSCKYGVLVTLLFYEVIDFPLLFIYLLLWELFIVSKNFQIQNVFSKYFCGSIEISLFVSINTCNGKAAYI